MTAPAPDARPPQQPRELTGRMVLLCLIGFFVAVASVNAVMIRAALSTFGGVETESSYKAGLKFMRDVADATAQDARRWQVTAHLEERPGGDARLDVTGLDASGRPLADCEATARLVHPEDARRDRTFALTAMGPGRFVGTVQADPGQWDLDIEISRSGERLFRSRERVILKAGAS